MTSKALVNAFVAQQQLAVVGVSRNSQKFGNLAYRELKAKGYQLYPIHPQADTLEGDPAFKDFASLPVKVGGVLVVVQPGKAEQVVRQAAEAGIKRVWLQQGSESQAALKACEENQMEAVHGECIMMYAVGTGIHGFHRRLWKWFGKAPK
jgi:hypothetical protein